ncbi:hypothetical protein Tco_1437895 [Tanacetum coccineum]
MVANDSLIVGLVVCCMGGKRDGLIWFAIGGDGNRNFPWFEICCAVLRDAGAGTGDVCLSRSRALTISFNSATSGDTPEVEALAISAIEMLWEWRGIANMAFIQVGGKSREDEMILARSELATFRDISMRSWKGDELGSDRIDDDDEVPLAKGVLRGTFDGIRELGLLGVSWKGFLKKFRGCHEWVGVEDDKMM